MNNKIIKQIMGALFLVMVIMQSQNAKGADVFTAGNLATILKYADGASTTNSTLLSTNATDPATVITLSSFTAVPSETKINTININWITASEIDTAGFNIYRDEAYNGQYTAKLNPELIPSTGSSTNGVSYSFEDTTVTTGNTYYYKLGALDLSGNLEIFGPVIAKACPNQTDAECDDGVFCNGVETCQSSSCVNGPPPCTQGQVCNEDTQCSGSSSSTSTIIPVSTTTTTTNANSTTSTTSGGGGGTSTTSTVSVTTSIITTSTTSPLTTSTTTISPTSTTTTTQLSTTTTKPTTTTTIRSGPCAAEAIYGENSEETELLRKYRDNVLSKTPEGHEIINTYYKLSPTVTMLLKQRPLLKNRAKTFIDGMLQGIRKKVEESNKEP